MSASSSCMKNLSSPTQNRCLGQVKSLDVIEVPGSHEGLAIGSTGPRFRLMPRPYGLHFIEPQVPTLVDQPPQGPGWIHEVKHDGYRTLVVVERGKARAYTRNGFDWSHRYRSIVRGVTALACRAAILDGEVIVQDSRGISDFEALKTAIKWQPERLFFYVFDLLHLDGRDLRSDALLERRAKLRELIETDPGSPLQFSEEFTGEGAELFSACAEGGLEGIVSKQATSRYRSGRSKAWLKTKCFTEGSFVIIGIDRDRKTGAMRTLLARDDGDGLTYAGAAFIALPAEAKEQLLFRLQELSFELPPIPGLQLKTAQWIKPNVVVRARHLAGSKSLRHATVKAIVEFAT